VNTRRNCTLHWSPVSTAVHSAHRSVHDWCNH